MVLDSGGRGQTQTVKVAISDPASGKEIKCQIVHFGEAKPEDVPAAALPELYEHWVRAITALNTRWVSFTPERDRSIAPHLELPPKSFGGELSRLMMAFAPASVYRAWQAAHSIMVQAAIKGMAPTWETALQPPDVTAHFNRSPAAGASTTSVGSKGKGEYAGPFCMNWNTRAGKQCNPDPDPLCQRLHKCSICGKDHPKKEHPNA